ncbi:MAG: T9SS type A sorting domain-containing protein [Saprospiraceae bacterium]|nr:T9SS type A sorting domain-containing protein [Candidatus Vicinibacter affinis]
MKQIIVFIILFLGIIVSNSAQDCIETINNSLSIVSKQNFGGADCLFTIRFCLKKSTTDAKTVEFAVNHTYGTMTRVKNIETLPVGTVFCEDFTFVAECNSTASFLAEGKRSNLTVCGVISDFLILPIRLVDFTAEISKNGSIEIRWQTAVEQNVSHFVIEKSFDGRNFKDFQKVKAAGNSNVLKNYYIETLPTNINLVNYFRLKMFDLDGSYTISKIASTKNDRAKKLRIYPNPASGVLVVEARENLSPQLSKITDLNGKIINCPILNDPLTFDISQLQPGVYFLFVNEEIQKFIKE